MRKMWKLFCAAVMGVAAAGPARAEDMTITMGTMPWEALLPISLVTKKVLEDAGYTVKLTRFSEWGIAYAALTKGDVQVLASQTDYVAYDYWTKSKNRLEKLSPVSHGLFQGLAVPKYVPIDSIEQLNDNADKFDRKIIGIEPGAGLMRDAKNAVDRYGLKYQIVEGSTAAMTASLKSAIDRQQWTLTMLWEPSWMVQKYDVKFLKDPKGVFPPPQGFYWIATKGFAAGRPRAREAMASVYLPLAAITSINGAVKDGKTMEEATSDWMTANADLIRRWKDIKKD